MSVVILRLATTTFMASSNRQLNQDQAYELAASLGSSIDALIDEGKFSLDSITSDKKIYERSSFSGMPNTSVTVEVDVEEHSKTVIVTAKVKKAQYVYTKEYAS
jgi:predicted transcriptional regulator